MIHPLWICQPSIGQSKTVSKPMKQTMLSGRNQQHTKVYLFHQCLVKYMPNSPRTVNQQKKQQILSVDDSGQIGTTCDVKQ